MNRLIAINFTSIKKSKLLGLGIIAVIAYACYLVFLEPYTYSAWMRRQILGFEEIHRLDWILFGCAAKIDDMSFWVCILFLWKEYHDGALRGKLMNGYRRGQIYFANQMTCTLVVCLLTGIAFLATYLFGVSTISWGYPKSESLYLRLKYPPPSFGEAMALVLAGMFVAALYCAVYTMIGMMCTHLVSALIISLLFSHVVGYFSTAISALSEGLMIIELRYPGMTVSGNGIEDLSGLPKGIKFIVDILAAFLPGAQAALISGGHVERVPYIIAGALFMLLVVTGAGMYLFRKKNLK